MLELYMEQIQEKMKLNTYPVGIFPTILTPYSFSILIK